MVYAFLAYVHKLNSWWRRCSHNFETAQRVLPEFGKGQNFADFVSVILAHCILSSYKVLLNFSEQLFVRKTYRRSQRFTIFFSEGNNGKTKIISSTVFSTVPVPLWRKRMLVCNTGCFIHEGQWGGAWVYETCTPVCGITPPLFTSTYASRSAVEL